MIIDSHCHIYDEKLNENRKEILENLIIKNQVAICCGDNIFNSNKCVELANNNKNIFAAVGVHPECVDDFTVLSVDKLKEMANKNKKVIAIGEIGLDYHYDNQLAQNQIDDNHLKQKEVLVSQINLAKKLNLPCIFHVRDATKDFLEILKNLETEFKNNQKLNNLNCKSDKKFSINGVVHSFSGSLEVAQIYINYGLYLGVNGIVTFKNAKNIIDVVKNVPLENILIETDSPYLTPEPFRGKVNKPEFVKLVAKKIAEIKNLDIHKVINITTKNAVKLFKLGSLL